MGFILITFKRCQTGRRPTDLKFVTELSGGIPYFYTPLPVVYFLVYLR